MHAGSSDGMLISNGSGGMKTSFSRDDNGWMDGEMIMYHIQQRSSTGGPRAERGPPDRPVRPATGFQNIVWSAL